MFWPSGSRMRVTGIPLRAGLTLLLARPLKCS